MSSSAKSFDHQLHTPSSTWFVQLFGACSGVWCNADIHTHHAQVFTGLQDVQEGDVVRLTGTMRTWNDRKPELHVAEKVSAYDGAPIQGFLTCGSLPVRKEDGKWLCYLLRNKNSQSWLDWYFATIAWAPKGDDKAAMEQYLRGLRLRKLTPEDWLPHERQAMATWTFPAHEFHGGVQRSMDRIPEYARASIIRKVKEAKSSNPPSLWNIASGARNFCEPAAVTAKREAVEEVQGLEDADAIDMLDFQLQHHGLEHADLHLYVSVVKAKGDLTPVPGKEFAEGRWLDLRGLATGEPIIRNLKHLDQIRFCESVLSLLGDVKDLDGNKRVCLGKGKKLFQERE